MAREVLVECARAASRQRDSYVAAQFWRLARRIGKKKAALAVEHSILVIAWHLPHNQTNYTDLGADWLVRATDNTHRRDRLGQLVAEGTLTRNVALLVDRVPGKAKKFETFTADQVRVVLDGVPDDRNRHAWHVALAGMRRGEIAGQRWDDVDLENKVIRIGPTRVDVRGRALDQDDPKTVAAERPLPIPDRLLAELKAARARQATEKLALGRAYNDQGYVVCNEAGEPYHPSTITKLWADAIRGLDVPQIRLHDARHTCATLMHLQNVPIALVAAWLGHADLSFTMRTYVHAQPEALQQAADSFAICPSKAIE